MAAAMTFNEAVAYVRRSSNGFLATTEGDEPHVRPMTVWRADETGFYFYTSRVKPILSQIEAHPKVEIAFHEPGTSPDIGTVLRIAGKAEIVDDMDVRRNLWDIMPWLEEIGSPDTPTIVVFKIASGRYNFWTWENKVSPGPWIQFP
jgi:uncharacterized pyridoxamine 5'-phosphate oxidase family protein